VSIPSAPPSLWFVRPRRACVRCVGSDIQEVLSVEGIEVSARRAGGLEISAGSDAVGRAQARFGQDWIFEPVLSAPLNP